MADLVVNVKMVNQYNGHLLDANAVKGTYVALNGTTEKKEDIPSAVLVDGSLVYDANEDKTYIYKNGQWQVKTEGTAAIGDLALDEVFIVQSDGKATINPLYRSGYLAVKNIVARNSVDRTNMEVGTRCWVESEKKFYKLTLTPSNTKVWEDDNQTDSFDGYATADRHGTVSIGANLTTNDQGQLIVDVADREEEGSTKPISAGAVYEILGDIKSRLENI